MNTRLPLAVLFAGLAFIPFSANAVAPADFGLSEGDMISSAQADGNPDIFIVNQYGYKRLFLNETIFHFYGHLRISNVRQVSPSTRDAFHTSLLFRNCEAGDARVFAVEVTGGDTGTLHPLAISEQQAAQEDPEFSRKVFCINSPEFDWYTNGGRTLGSYYTSLGQIPGYGATSTPSSSPVSPVSPTPTNASALFNFWAPSVSELLCLQFNDDLTELQNVWGGSGTYLRNKSGNYQLLTNAHVSDNATFCFAKFLKDPSGRTALNSNLSIYLAKGIGYLSTSSDDDEALMGLAPLNTENADFWADFFSKVTGVTLGTNIFPTSLDSVNALARHELCEAGDAAIGKQIAVIGYPGNGSSKTATLTLGYISGIEGNYYVSDAKIEHGNSGGAAIVTQDNCYFGIPTGSAVGEIESFARILDITRFQVFGKIPKISSFLDANISEIFKRFF